MSIDGNYYYLHDEIYQNRGRIETLENKLNRLTEELKRTQEALRLALSALGKLTNTDMGDLPIGAQFGMEPPPSARDWKMKPIDAEKA